MIEREIEREIARQVAGLVAPELGAGWTVDTDPALQEHRGTYLDGPDGMRLLLYLDWKTAGRLIVQVCYPDGARKPYGVECHKIGVGLDRGPDVIAREITRRLLPAYTSELASVGSRLDRDDANRAAREMFATQVGTIVPAARLLPHRQSITSTEISLPGYGNEITINYAADEITLGLRLTPAQAMDVLRLVYVAEDEPAEDGGE